MRDYSFQNILYLGKAEAPLLLTEWCGRNGIALETFHDPMRAIKEKKEEPALIFSQVIFNNIKGLSLIRELQNRWPGSLIVALDRVGVESFVSEVIRSGVTDYLMEPIEEEGLFRTMEKCEVALRMKRDHRKLLKKAERSELAHQERAVILETLLDLLSHDTRNMFLNLRSLLRQFDEGPLRTMTEDSVDELYNTTMEAVGYLHSGRRLHSLVELVSQLRLTKDRIPLDGHTRINYEHDSQYLLFAETTPLIKNAITNLVENAFKYSPEDSPITVTLHRDETHWQLRVADEGIGIPDEDKKSVFDRYFRTGDTGAVEGTGRGLWITRNIVKEEGGTISIEDNEGGGTVFVMTLPLFRLEKPLKEALALLCEDFEIPKDEMGVKSRNIMTLLELQGYKNYPDFDSLVYANLVQTLRKEKQEEHRRHFRVKLHALKKKNPHGPRVLVVDDSLYVHYYLGTYLTSLGYRVVDFARNGEEGVSFYKAFEPEFVTLDVTMPVKSGVEAARELKRDYPEMKILFLTGLGDNETLKRDLNEFLDPGQYGVLAKPFKLADLRGLIKRLQLPLPVPPGEEDS